MKQKTGVLESTLAQQCYDQLQDHIINGAFLPGEKLKVDTLKKRLAVGQSPVREALSRLVASGLITVNDNKGFRVALVSEADIRDIYRTFTQIEILALTQAMELGDDHWESRVVGALHNLALVENKKDQPVSYDIWAERNYAFHVALISGCGSPILMQIRADLYKRFDRYCRMAFVTTQEQLEMNHEAHKVLAQAVLSRDVGKVTQFITHHLNAPLESIIYSLKENNII